ncbi:MAG: LytTR family transcriptional regulator [Acidobacteria bacterium]|nr:LytTR family transcriptional regulator [Acidobacteriota bacterium]
MQPLGRAKLRIVGQFTCEPYSGRTCGCVIKEAHRQHWKVAACASEADSMQLSLAETLITSTLWSPPEFAPNFRFHELHRILSRLERLATGPISPNRLLIPQSGPVRLSLPKTSIGSKLKATSRRGEYEFRQTLATLEEKLDPSEFLRIHRFTIVNIHPVKEIQA